MHFLTRCPCDRSAWRAESNIRVDTWQERNGTRWPISDLDSKTVDRAWNRKARPRPPWSNTPKAWNGERNVDVDVPWGTTTYLGSNWHPSHIGEELTKSPVCPVCPLIPRPDPFEAAGIDSPSRLVPHVAVEVGVARRDPEWNRSPTVPDRPRRPSKNYRQIYLSAGSGSSSRRADRQVDGRSCRPACRPARLPTTSAKNASQCGPSRSGRHASAALRHRRRSAS